MSFSFPVRQKIHQALLSEGFKAIYDPQSKSHRYEGEVECLGQAYRVSVLAPDPDLVKHPIIRLIDRPDTLPDPCAHIPANGEICYSQPGRDHFDVYHADAHILICLKEAARVLEAALRRSSTDDIQAEFLRYWDGEEHLLCDVGPNEPNGWFKLKRAIHRDSAGNGFLLVGNPEAFDRYENAGYQLIDEMPSRVFVTAAKSPPIAGSSHWPPDNLGELMDWLKSVDSGSTYSGLTRAICDAVPGEAGFYFLVRTLGSWWGVKLTEDAKSKSTFKDHGKRTQRAWLKRVQRYGRKQTIERIIVERADEDYLVTRNLGERRGLGGKNILIAGCGTIGGYLADLLVRSGAGTRGGSLTVCDNDLLLPANIGRHYLGVDRLYMNKANALCSDLGKVLPHAAVVPTSRDALEIPIKKYDLVIDATGNESVSVALNRRVLEEIYKTAGVFVWNEGDGIACQALLVDSHKHACFRCLRHADGNPRFSSIKDGGLVDYYRMGTGCDSAYIPYPAMVSMQAAALAAGVVLDWAEGRPGYRLRTITLDKERGREVPDKSPAPTKGCPACGS